MKKENVKSIFALVTAIPFFLPLFAITATLSLLAACSPPNDANDSKHAGVLTETESGHTMAFAIESDADRIYEADPFDKIQEKPAKVKFALTKIIDGKTTLFDTATVDYGDYAVFEDARGTYSVVATAVGVEGKNDTLFGAEILRRNDIDTVYVRVQEPATLKLSTTYKEEVVDEYPVKHTITQNALGEGYTVCITGTLACKEITKADIEQGYTVIKNIPLFDNEHWVNQIEIENGDNFHTLGVDWGLTAGDTLLVSEQVSAKYHLFDIDITLPESDLFDSLGDHELDSLIVPVKWYNKQGRYTYFSQYSHFFLDEHNSLVEGMHKNKLSEDTTLLWVVVPQIDSSAKIFAYEGEINSGVSTYTRLVSYWPETDKDTLWRWVELFEDSSFAVSFWIEQESLADSSVILGSCDSLGFEIRRCNNDTTAICTRIRNGIDTASTDSVEYGKANILDGKRHHYALVLHKKHLTIAVDGVTIRDTDLKLSDDFYKMQGIWGTPGIAKDILYFYFGDFIKHEKDKDWTRLKAWLYAFYELQKDI